MNWKTLLLGKWSWKRPIYSLLVIYLLLLLVVTFFANRLIFPAPGTPYPEDQTHYYQIQTPSEQISIYYRPPKPGKPTLHWSHGNATNLGQLQPMLDYLHRQGFGVLAYDYPGYGQSSGKPSEKGCYEAAKTTYEHLTHQLNCSPDDIIIVGRSVGTGPATWLATQVPHQSLLLISPFKSAFQTVTRIPLFPFDRFPNLKHICQVETPLTVIHGEKDKTIPHSQGKQVFNESPSPLKSFISLPDSGHNDLFKDPSVSLPQILSKLHQSNQ